jgi:hypothetical protein
VVVCAREQEKYVGVVKSFRETKDEMHS